MGDEETPTGRALRLLREEAVAAERSRCAAIVQAARHGEIDGDLRSIISRIQSGAAFPEQEGE